MPSRGRPPARWLAGALALAALAGGAVAVAEPEGSAGKRSPAAAQASAAVLSTPGTAASSTAESGRCGPATQQTIAAVDAKVAERIYAGEIGGREVEEDLRHIAGSQELVSAVASSNGPATYAAVHAIVYTPHWHIVRLRAVENGRVLADVGGPYIIAPVTGTLRQGGRKVGTFTMSVQDDVGYVKLVTRFTGVPIDLYRGGSFVLGTLQPAPSPPVDGASVRARGGGYLASTLDALAFPSGRLKVALFVPAPSSALSRQTCAAVRNEAWGSVVKHIAGRFPALAEHYEDFIGTLQGSTGGFGYVRIGAHQVAGHNAGPRHIPPSGTVRYRGHTWHVFSWAPYPPARVYFLAPS